MPRYRPDVSRSLNSPTKPFHLFRDNAQKSKKGENNSHRESECIEEKNNRNVEPLLETVLNEPITNNNGVQKGRCQFHKSSTRVELQQAKIKDELANNNEEYKINEHNDDSERIKKILNTWKDRYINIDHNYKEKPKRAKSLPTDLKQSLESISTIVIEKPEITSILFDKQISTSKEEPENSDNRFNNQPQYSKELLIIEPAHSDKDTNSYDIDNILNDPFDNERKKPKITNVFSQRSNSITDAELAVDSRDDSPNKKVLKRILKSNKVQKKNDYYEIELNSVQHTRNRLSYVVAVGMTMGAVGMYVASQTVKRGLGLLRYLN